VANHGPFPWQVDGDYLGEVERIEVRYVPDALRLVVPAER
jgi:diacylglycerol kinase family enzyme